jgi:ribosomal protein S10|tara:strand:- start:5649 stop:6134 length:486 start_codon:yes stop_codon:yes gene_type:complete
MFINIHISSKNYKSIKLFSSFFTNKILTEKLKLTTTSLFFQNPVKKKIFTVLKSPHVNKTAQEHFEYSLYTRQFKVHSSKGSLLLIFLKKLKHNIFFDVILKIEIVNQPLKYNQKLKNKINPDNFMVISNDTCLKKYIKVLNNYGNLILKQKNFCLDSSVG